MPLPVPEVELELPDEVTVSDCTLSLLPGVKLARTSSPALMSESDAVLPSLMMFELESILSCFPSERVSVFFDASTSWTRPLSRSPDIEPLMDDDEPPIDDDDREESLVAVLLGALPGSVLFRVESTPLALGLLVPGSGVVPLCVCAELAGGEPLALRSLSPATAGATHRAAASAPTIHLV